MPDDSVSKKFAESYFNQFQSVILRALRSRTNRPEDIEDLAQEVYLRLLRVPKPEMVENPKSYLYRVALNVAEEWQQRASQRLIHSSDELSGLLAKEDIEEDEMRRRREKLIRQSLVSLSQAHRTAVILHIRDGMTYEQIGVHMGVTRRAVKRYIAKGYAALRTKMNALGHLNPVQGDTGSTEEFQS